jgi:hypothetical protein
MIKNKIPHRIVPWLTNLVIKWTQKVKKIEKIQKIHRFFEKNK